VSERSNGTEQTTELSSQSFVDRYSSCLSGCKLCKSTAAPKHRNL